MSGPRRGSRSSQGPTRFRLTSAHIFRDGALVAAVSDVAKAHELVSRAEAAVAMVDRINAVLDDEALFVQLPPQAIDALRSAVSIVEAA